MRITKKITSIVLAVLMVVSMMSVMAVSASAAEETSTVTWNSFPGNGGMSSGGVTLTTTQGNTRMSNCFYSGRGTATFTAPEGSVFTKIEIKNCEDVSSLNFPGATVAQSGGYSKQDPWDDEPTLVPYYTVTWTGESSGVTFSGDFAGIQSIVFTLKSTAPAIPTISNATELSNACLTGGEYNLAADITTNYNYLDADLIIHGNGHTIKSGSDYSVFYWGYDKDADLTLDNVTLDGNGKKGIAVDVTTDATDAQNNSGCNVTFDTVTCKNFVSDYPQGVGAVYLYGKSNGTFTNCTFDNNTVSTTGTNGFNGADIWFGGAGNLVISGGSYDEVYVNGGTASATVSNGAAIDSLNAAKGSKIATDSPEKISVGEDYKLKNNGDGSYTVVPKDYVAQIEGGAKFETLEEAFAAAVDGDTITVLADCSGNGIKVLKNTFATGLTVDFGGHTYTVDGETVGSPGTETLAFQLQYGNNITFKNGTLYSEKAKMLVQNYSNLTLDGMTLTFNNTSYNGAYTLSNNNGNTVIKDTTINANPTPGSFAFDVCRGGGSNAYPSVNVTVTGNSVINGNVEVYAKNADPKNGFSLTLASGTMTGNIVVDPTAKAVLDAKSDKGVVTKNNAFGQTAPEGLVWEDNGNGTSSLVPAEVNPLDALITKASDSNQFKITSQYYAGTILGVQKKEKITNAAVTSDKGTQEAAEGSDMRFVAVLDTNILRGADDYGFVLAKVGSDKDIDSVGNEGLDKLKKGDDRFKTISAVNTYNTVCGTNAAAKKYGDPTDATTAYKYITCAVNGVDDSSKIVARFYVVIDGKTYYGKYAGHSYKYRGAVAGISDLV